MIDTIKPQMPIQQEDSLFEEHMLFKSETYKMLRDVEILLHALEENEISKEMLETKILELEQENQMLKRNEEQLKRQLNAYKNSKLGKITKRYWAWRKKWFRRGRR